MLYFQLVKSLWGKVGSQLSLGETTEFNDCGAKKGYEDYPLLFQSRFTIIEIISKEEQTLLSKMNQGWPGISDIRKINNKLIKPQQQFGGEPKLPQGELDELICPMCKKLMPLLAMIGNDCDHPQGSCGSDYVAVIYYYCNKCPVVGVVQQCD